MYQNARTPAEERKVYQTIARFERRFKRMPPGYFKRRETFGTFFYVNADEWEEQWRKRWHRRTGGDYQI